MNLKKKKPINNYYQVGDNILFNGSKGTVKQIIKQHEYPLVIKFDNGEYMCFTMNGKLFPDQTYPVLIKVYPKDKAVTKSIDQVSQPIIKYACWNKDLFKKTNIKHIVSSKEQALALKRKQKDVLFISRIVQWT